jgi:hypothetical protein
MPAAMWRYKHRILRFAEKIRSDRCRFSGAAGSS